MTQQLEFDIETPEIKTERQSGTKWSEGIIWYDGGYAWSITETGKLVCLGNERTVRMAIINPQLKSHVPEIDQIIKLERELLREVKDNDGTIKLQSTRKFRASKTRDKRNRPAKNIKRGANNLKRLTV